mgnify:FL=1
MDIAHVILDMYPNANWTIEGYDYDGLVWMSEDIPKPTREEVIARTNEMELEQPMLLLRTQRDKLLAETDWVTWRAYSQGVSVPTEWATYQQALRDLPANTADPANPVWPTKPS